MSPIFSKSTHVGCSFLLAKFMAVVNVYRNFALLTFRKHFALITQTLGLYSNTHKVTACFMMTNTMEKMNTTLNNNHKQILINISATIEGKTNLRKRPKTCHNRVGLPTVTICCWLRISNIDLYVFPPCPLCDWEGIKPFIEILTYYYCLMGYQSTASRAGNRLASDALFEGEAVAPFLEPYDKDQSKDLVDISRYADQEIHANIATDMRSTLDVPNTFKNWVKTLCSSTLN